jgi:hypothetical protein
MSRRYPAASGGRSYFRPRLLARIRHAGAACNEQCSYRYYDGYRGASSLITADQKARNFTDHFSSSQYPVDGQEPARQHESVID